MPQMEVPLLDLGVSGNQYRPRKVLYAEVLSNLRVVMIERMVKPEEVSSLFIYLFFVYHMDCIF